MSEKSSSPFSAPEETPTQDNELPIEYLPPSPKKNRSWLALICAIALTVGAFGALYRQSNIYMPQVKRSLTSSFYQLIHKEQVPAFKTKAAADLVPLARIIVSPPKPLNPPNQTNVAIPTNVASPTPINNSPSPVNTPSASGTPGPTEPETLNIHGVMSNGANNVVLIDDEVYQEGDEVDGVKILKINLDYITVLNNGKVEKIHVKN